MTQLSLTGYVERSTKPTAPAGIKRAARAGSRVDAAVLAVCRDNIGRSVTEGDFWALVTARVTCVPDTARRRRDALEAEGHLQTERLALGVVRVVAVLAMGGETK